ncbi:MAG: hypothetical protein NDI61_14365, partial [Bdellovibrionaceae bacterium]|nr:hypothetical protein [Pseudobdellovibrionaceae bacterium]
MISPRRYFPWKIVRHYALRASLFYVLALVGAGYSIRYYAIKTFLPATDMATALAEFDVYLSTIGLLLVFIGAIYVVWSARLYFYPMGRMIQRARELRKGRIDMESGSGLADDFSSEEPGEWADLERGLERIHSDLRQKTDQLAREREELAALISAVANAILAIDRNEEPLFFNSSFAVLFGV